MTFMLVPLLINTSGGKRLKYVTLGSIVSPWQHAQHTWREVVSLPTDNLWESLDGNCGAHCVPTDQCHRHILQYFASSVRTRIAAENLGVKFHVCFLVFGFFLLPGPEKISRRDG